MSEENVESLREMFGAAARAISGERLEDLYRLLDPDVEWIPINAALEGTRYRGHGGVRRWIDEMNRDWDDFEALPNRFIDLGNDRLLAFGTWRARGRTSGVELDAQPAAWLVRLRNKKVLRMQTFTDRADALEAAGLRGKAPGLTFGDYQAEAARHNQAGIDSLSMAAVIALCPETERGREILDELEKRTKMHPMKLLKDGTRRYHLHAEDADVDAFDPILNEIDSEWRNHVTNWRAAEGFPWDTFFGARPVDDRQQRDYPPGD